MRGIEATNLEYNESLVQVELKIDLSQLCHYFFFQRKLRVHAFRIWKRGPRESRFYFEMPIKNRFFKNFLVVI